MMRAGGCSSVPTLIIAQPACRRAAH